MDSDFVVVVEFLTDLENKSHDCDFGLLREFLIRDIFIANLHFDLAHVRQRLLQQQNLALKGYANWRGRSSTHRKMLKKLSRSPPAKTSCIYVAGTVVDRTVDSQFQSPSKGPTQGDSSVLRSAWRCERQWRLAVGQRRADAAPLKIVNKSFFDWWAAPRKRKAK
ncbi:unnamed protein product [Arctia plantaginis]|uniref:Uncharacterized protein n=1 Tax=Arctia plantaginis TaxID=874455 RepID=A0A8S0ZQ37_ARCPL|nr:unnamed protein product [Arctia plantaginis]